MNKTYRYKLAVDFNEPIRFGDLAHLIAQCMYPDEGSMQYGVARLNLEKELEGAVQNREITVRNAVSLGPNTLLVGEALKSSVVLADDILDYLGSRGVELINLSPIKSASSDKKKNKWGEPELQQLFTESIQPGMTHQKLADYYGVTRQFIGRKLEKFRKPATPRRASPFDALDSSRRK